MNELVLENKRLKDWLQYIADGPERETWWEDRDDAARELVNAAKSALDGETYTEEEEEDYDQTP